MQKIFLSAFIILVAPFINGEIKSQTLVNKHYIDLQTRLENIESNPAAQMNHVNSSLKKKKAGLAVIYSMLLPGMGELYAESYHSGKYFTITEAALWITFIGMNTYAGWKEESYKSYAQGVGKTNNVGKDEDFFANIGKYVDIDEYNHEKSLQREFNAIYNAETHYWNWGADDKRKEYRNLWLDSEHAYNNLRFIIGAMLLNRVISSINAVRLVSLYNKNLGSSDLTWNLYFEAGILTDGSKETRVNFIKRF